MADLGKRKKLVSLENFMDGGKARMIDSPRSLEACLRQGLDPASLFPKPLSKWQEEEELREVAVCKYEHYEQKRLDRLAQARSERNIIVRFLEDARKSGNARLSPAFQKLAAATAPSESGSIQSSQTGKDVESSMLAEERKRIAILKKRQQKDIEQMMQFEMNIVKMQKEQKRLEDIELQKKAARAAEREKKRLAAVAKRSKMELAKKQAAEEEEERMKEQARRDYKFAEKQKKEMVRREKEAKRLAREKEMERIRLKAARQKQLEDIQSAQEADIKRKLDLMQEQERARRERREREAREMQEKQRAKKEAARLRITKAVQANEAILHKKREDFWEKEAANRQRQQERLAAQKELAQKKAAKLAQKQAKRKKALNDAFENDIRNAQRIERERRERERRVAENAQKRFATDMVAKTKEELRKKDKLENIERMKRIDEFIRLQTLQKIAADEERTRSILREKEELKKQRQRMAARQRASKSRLQDGVAKLRQTQRWDKLDEIMCVAPPRPPPPAKPAYPCLAILSFIVLTIVSFLLPRQTSCYRFYFAPLRSNDAVEGPSSKKKKKKKKRKKKGQRPQT